MSVNVVGDTLEMERHVLVSTIFYVIAPAFKSDLDAVFLVSISFGKQKVVNVKIQIPLSSAVSRRR